MRKGLVYPYTEAGLREAIKDLDVKRGPLSVGGSVDKVAALRLHSYGGYTETNVKVVGETPKRYIIEAIVRTKLAGGRWLAPGQRAYVPKETVRWS